jgi:hypothetical protein
MGDFLVESTTPLPHTEINSFTYRHIEKKSTLILLAYSASFDRGFRYRPQFAHISAIVKRGAQGTRERLAATQDGRTAARR